MTTDYCGNAVYENGMLKMLLNEAGYVSFPDKKYHFYLKDHQGNTRVVADKDGNVEETNSYYPFGGTFTSTANIQPYKYNGKELDQKNGLNWYDYGARHYDAAIGRWHVVDPSVEKYHNWSPYVYCKNSPIMLIDPDGKDGIYIAFPDYKISTPLGKIGGLGHAGVLLINNKTGLTKYYEYGRYDVEEKGIVRTISVPDVKIGKDGKPTLESLNKTFSVISKEAGHGGKIEGAYVESDNFEKMNGYANSKKKENSDPKRKKYSITSNNCGTFAADVLNQDPNVKEKAPFIIDKRPNSMIEEYQDNFDSVTYDPDKKKTQITKKK